MRLSPFGCAGDERVRRWRRLLAQQLSELLDRGTSEHGRQRQPLTEFLLQPCDQIDREQRVAADLEEIVAHADRMQFQHGFPGRATIALP